jgi:hypothetical protein
MSNPSAVITRSSLAIARRTMVVTRGFIGGSASAVEGWAAQYSDDGERAGRRTFTLRLSLFAT